VRKPRADRFRPPWAWPAGGDLDRNAGDRDREQLWVCPGLPPVHLRDWYPLRVELSYWLRDTTALNELLYALWEKFERDSVLAAVVHKPATTDLLLYTIAREGIVHERHSVVRQTLRLPAAGIGITADPRWVALEVLEASRSGASR
jgi:hypothetical protein